MKDEIKGGADVIQVVSKYLDTAGVGMDALKIRTEGAVGKMNELKVETEKFQLALGGQAGGPGLALLEARIALTQNATRLLSGDTKTLTNDMIALGNALNPVALITNTVSSSNGVCNRQIQRAHRQRTPANLALYQRCHRGVE
jgi:hypothetical protein